MIIIIHGFFPFFFFFFFFFFFSFPFLLRYGTACQSIFFATSKDLKNWTRVPFKPPPANDTEVFKYTDGGFGGTNPGYTIGGTKRSHRHLVNSGTQRVVLLRPSKVPP